LTGGTQVSGHLVKTIRYEGTDQYIKEHLGYTVDYQPTRVKYTIPNNATASGVDGAFTYVYTYHPDGSTATTRLPALGDPGLGLETLTHGYNSLGKPTTLSTSLGATLVEAPGATIPGTEYTSLGELAAITSGTMEDRRSTSHGCTTPAPAVSSRSGPHAQLHRTPSRTSGTRTTRWATSPGSPI
jgi:hypothetical protein